MTYDEAKKLKTKLLKRAIRARLHKYNPTKYPDIPRDRRSIADQMFEIHQMTMVIHEHEHGCLFDRDNKWFKFLREGKW